MKYTTVYTAAVSAAAIAAPSYAHDQVRNLRADDGDESLTAASPEPQFFTDWWKYIWKKPEVSLTSVYTLQTQPQLVHLSHAHANDRSYRSRSLSLQAILFYLILTLSRNHNVRMKVKDFASLQRSVPIVQSIMLHLVKHLSNHSPQELLVPNP